VKRVLADFGPLSPAERQLRDKICSGELVILGDGKCPGAGAGSDRHVRAEFLRYLILGGCASLPGTIPENGVQIRGAWVTGPLDLEGARIPRDVVLAYCRFQQPPNLMSTRLDSFNLTGSALPGLSADGLQAEGDMVLRDVQVSGELRLLGAKLGGDLSCTGARLEAGKSGNALSADRLQAEGGVFLRDVQASGELRLLGAKLGGDLDCDGARLKAGKSGRALNAGGLQAEGNMFLRDVQASGELRLLGAKLGGDLDCADARLEAGKSGKALNVGGAQIVGAFFLRQDARIKGVLDLTGAQIGHINDEERCWPGAAHLILDRCRYGAFTGGPVDAGARIRWLDLQDPARWGKDFWPQPWEHCAKVLREMGHTDDARQILIAKEARQRRWRRDKLKARLEGARLRLRAERLTPDRIGPLVADVKSASETFKGPMLAELNGQINKSTLVIKQAIENQVQDLAALEAELSPRLMRAGVFGFDPALNAHGAVVETQAKLFIRRVVDGVLSVTLAYGHRPFRAVTGLVFFWLLGALFFGIAAGQDAIKPNSLIVLRSAEWAACHPAYEPPANGPPIRWDAGAYSSQLGCFLGQPEAAGYPRFNALVYSADTLLPIVAMEMQEFWIPDEAQGTRGAATRVFLWVQIAMGWALSLLAVAGFSGLVKSD